MRLLIALSLCVVLLLASAQMAPAHELEPEDAGHPLKAVRLVLYPVGYIAYHGVVRPVHWFISLPGARNLFGHEPKCCDGISAEPCDRCAYSESEEKLAPVPKLEKEAAPAEPPHAEEQQ